MLATLNKQPRYLMVAGLWPSAMEQSDLDMIRVLEDLITVLIRKGVVRITDLPEAAQSKLVGRSKARDALGGLHRLINDDESELI